MGALSPSLRDFLPSGNGRTEDSGPGRGFYFFALPLYALFRPATTSAVMS
jgi:hypothetical protein